MPRTFVGPLALAGVSWPFLRFGATYGGEIRGQLIGESHVRKRMVRETYGNVFWVGEAKGNKRG